jgi:hypothetical protein
VRLVTQSEFARSIGCTPQAISKACKPGGALYDSLYDNRIDIESKFAISYIDEREARAEIKKAQKKSKPKPKSKQKKAPPKPPSKTPQPPPKVETPSDHLEEFKTGEKDIRTMSEMTIEEVIATFGSAAEFDRWIKSVMDLEKTHALRIKNLVDEGKLVSRKIIKQGIIDPIDEVFTKILTDGSKSASIMVHTMALSGSTPSEIEDHIRMTFSKIIKPAKDRMGKAIGKFKDEN